MAWMGAFALSLVNQVYAWVLDTDWRMVAGACVLASLLAGFGIAVGYWHRERHGA